MSMLEAYILGDRLAAVHFRAAVWDLYIEVGVDLAYVSEMVETVSIFKLIKYACENMPSHNIVLQYFADNVCIDWSHKGDGTKEYLIQKELPSAFLLRALRRHSEKRAEEKEAAENAKAQTSLTKKKKTTTLRCYEEHTSGKEQSDCVTEYSFIRRLHMRYDEEADCGFFE
jgi:triosephosphate isomerase